MRQSRSAGARSRGAGRGLVTPISTRTWSLPLPVQPWATAVAPYLWAVSTSFLAMSGRRERAHQRVLLLVERVGHERRQAVVLGELLLGVDGHGVDGAGRLGALHEPGDVLDAADVDQAGDDVVAVASPAGTGSWPRCRGRRSTRGRRSCSLVRPFRLRSKTRLASTSPERAGVARGAGAAVDRRAGAAPRAAGRLACAREVPAR